MVTRSAGQVTRTHLRTGAANRYTAPMKITYTNPAPDEDFHPGEAVHWHDRGGRYFDYKDLWFEQLDRHHAIDTILAPLDHSPDHDRSEWVRELIASTGRGRNGLRRVGLITQDLGLARKMLDRRIDFIADFKSGLFFFDLRGGHEMFMEALFELHTGKTAGETKHGQSYIDAGLGIFKSSQSPYVEVGANTVLPGWAKLARLNLRRRDDR